MRLTMRFSSLGRRHKQGGLSMVELMVGITVGLIVTAGATMVAVRQINEHRRLMLEVQLQQDLRIAADLLQQDFRRAGFRGDPASGVWTPAHIDGNGAVAAMPAASSPYAEVDQPANSQEIYYQYSKPTSAGDFNTTNVVQDNEKFGVKLSNETLFVQLGVVNGQPNWQPITDPDSVSIKAFTPNIVTQVIPLNDLCDSSCALAGTCPTQTVRRVDFTIVGVAKFDANVKRTLTVSEKIRADDISGACPTP